jgi:hypothetical protein
LIFIKLQEEQQQAFNCEFFRIIQDQKYSFFCPFADEKPE